MPDRTTIERTVESRLARLKKDMDSLPAPLKKAFPPDGFLKDIRTTQRRFGFRYSSPRQIDFLERLRSEHGPAVSLYHKYSLASLMKGALKTVDASRYTEEIVELCYEWYERVLQDFTSQSDDHYDIKNPDFLQERGVCGLSVFPVGSVWMVEISAVSEEALAKKGTKPKGSQAASPSLKKRILRELNGLIQKMGLSPLKRLAYLVLKKERLYYHIHTYMRLIPRSAPAELEKAYLRIAVLLLKNPKIQGIYRATWLLDPQLEKISPHLAHLRKTPEENGARLYRLGTSSSDMTKSVQLSPARKKLMEEGHYTPVGYAYIWPRERVISWAEKHPGWPLNSCAR